MYSAFAVFGDYEQESQLYVSRELAELALKVIADKYDLADLSVKELSVYDYIMEDN